MTPQDKLPGSATPPSNNDPQVTLDEWEEQVRQHYSIPQNLWKAMPAQESSGDRNAVSPTGVRGKYMVTQSTAKQYGLNRDDPWQAPVAAAKYLREQYDSLGHLKDDDERWLGAVGRYYGGPSAVNGDQLSGTSVDGLSNPAQHVERVARKWGALNRGEAVTDSQPDEAQNVTPASDLKVSSQDIVTRQPYQGVFARSENMRLPQAAGAKTPTQTNQPAQPANRKPTREQAIEQAEAELRAEGAKAMTEHRTTLGQTDQGSESFLGNIANKVQREALGAGGFLTNALGQVVSVPRRILNSEPSNLEANLRGLTAYMQGAAEPSPQLSGVTSAGGLGNLAGMLAVGQGPGMAAKAILPAATIPAAIGRGAISGGATMALATPPSASDKEVAKQTLIGSGAGVAGDVLGLASGPLAGKVAARLGGTPGALAGAGTNVLVRGNAAGISNAAQSYAMGERDPGKLKEAYAVGAVLGNLADPRVATPEQVAQQQIGQETRQGVAQMLQEQAVRPQSTEPTTPLVKPTQTPEQIAQVQPQPKGQKVTPTVEGQVRPLLGQAEGQSAEDHVARIARELGLPVEEPQGAKINAPQPLQGEERPSGTTPVKTTRVNKPANAARTPQVGDVIEYETGYPPRTRRDTVVRLQLDPVTKEQVPIVQGPRGEVPVAEWQDSGRIVEPNGQETGQIARQLAMQPAVQSARQIDHTDFGRVTVADDQAGVQPGHLRVTDTAGDTHTIQRPTGQHGNQKAAWVRPETQPPSDYNRLTTENTETINALRSMNVEGAEAKPQVDALRAWAKAHGVEGHHVDNLLTEIKNTQLRQSSVLPTKLSVLPTKSGAPSVRKVTSPDQLPAEPTFESPQDRAARFGAMDHAELDSEIKRLEDQQSQGVRGKSKLSYTEHQLAETDLKAAKSEWSTRVKAGQVESRYGQLKPGQKQGQTSLAETEAKIAGRQQANLKAGETKQAARGETIKQDVTKLPDEQLQKRIRDAETILERTKDEPGFAGSEREQALRKIVEQGRREQEQRQQPTIEVKTRKPVQRRIGNIGESNQRTLSQFVRAAGGINPTEMLSGETARLGQKESATTGLTNKNSKLTAEYMMDEANAEGYRNKNGQPFENIGDFLRSVEADASGREQIYHPARELETEKGWQEYHAKFSDEDLQRQSDALDRIFESDEKYATIHQKLDEGKPLDESEIAHFRNSNDAAGIPEYTDATLADWQRERSGQSREAGRTAETLQNAGTEAEGLRGHAGAEVQNVEPPEVQAARERLKQRAAEKPKPNKERGSAPILQDLADYAIIGAHKLKQGVTKYADWSREMVKDLGEKIKPHLQQILFQARKFLSDETGAAKASPGPPKQPSLIPNARGNPREEWNKFLAKVGAIQSGAQLTGLPTLAKITAGHVGMFTAENAAAAVVAPLDWAVSKITGRRSVMIPRIGLQIAAAKQGAVEGYKNLKAGKPVNVGQTPLGTHERAFQGGLGRAIEDAVDLMHGIPNRAAWEAGFQRSFDSQVRAGQASQTQPSPQAIFERAVLEANEATFRDDNIFSKTLGLTKNAINRATNGDFNLKNPAPPWGVADLLGLRYTKIPGGVLARAVDYSPAGFGKAIVEMTNTTSDPAVKQRAVMMALGKGIVGTLGGTMTGAVLQNLGILTKSNAEKRGEQNVEQESGLSPFSWQLNLSALKRYGMGGLLARFSGGATDAGKLQAGDRLISINWAQPWALTMGLGADFARKMKQGQGSVSETMQTAAESLNEMVGRESSIRSMSDALKFIASFGDPKEGAQTRKQTGTSIAASAVTGFVPQQMQQYRNFRDPVQRDTRSESVGQNIQNRVMARLPFASEKLPARTSPLTGEPVKNERQGDLSRFVSPADVQTAKPTLVTDEMQRLGVGKNPPKRQSQEGFESLRGREQTAGNLFDQFASKLVESPAYNVAPDEIKKSAFEHLAKQTDTFSNLQRPPLYQLQPGVIMASAHQAAIKEKIQAKKNERQKVYVPPPR